VCLRKTYAFRASPGLRKPRLRFPPCRTRRSTRLGHLIYPRRSLFSIITGDHGVVFDGLAG
jgi:hypothetical protein